MDIAIYSTTYNNEKSYWWYTGRLLILKSVFETYISNRSLKILNIGCGTGYISKKFLPYGDIVNMDISAVALAFCKVNRLKYLTRGNAMALPFQSNFFDCVMAYDVLEHIEDDVRVMQEIKRCLTQKGKLILTVPAFKFLWSDMDNIGEHKRRYITKNLQVKVKKAGLKITKISYFNTFLFPLAVAERIFEKLSNKRVSGENFLFKMSPVLNYMFHLIFSSERFFLRHFNFPIGLSILLIGQA